MKTYLEIMENLTEEEMMIRQPMELRVEVADADEARAKYEELKGLFADRNYIARIHYCYHEDGLPCRLEIIEKHEVG